MLFNLTEGDPNQNVHTIKINEISSTGDIRFKTGFQFNFQTGGNYSLHKRCSLGGI